MPGDLVARLRLTADGRGFRGEVRASEQSVRRLSRAVGAGDEAARRYSASAREAAAAARGAGGAFDRAGRTALRYGAATLGVAAAMRAARAAVRSVVDASVRQEQALAQVEARIRSTGGAAGLATDEVARMAAELQQATSFGDESILEAQSVLLSFRRIARSSFAGATEAALNLSAAFGQDLRSAAIQLGKALDDPKRGLDALSRSGTTFTDAQKEQIRALFEAGRAGEAQAIILAEIEAQIGGTARAMRDTLGGALAALGNTWGDLLEVQAESSEGLRSWVEGLNDALRSVDPRELHDGFADALRIVGVLSGALAGRLAVSLLSVAGGAVAARRDALRLQLALAGLEGRSRSAALGMLALGRAARVARGALAFLGGPLGAVLTIGGAALSAFAFAQDEAADAAARGRRAIEEQTGSVSDLAAEYRKLTRAQVGARLDDLAAAHEESEREVVAAVRAHVRAQRRVEEQERFEAEEARRSGSRYDEGAESRALRGLREEAAAAEVARDDAIDRHAVTRGARARARHASSRAALDPRPSSASPQSGQDGAEAAEAAAAGGARLAAITRSTQDEIARLTQDRIALTYRAEERAVEELEALRGQPGVTETALQTAINAARQRGILQRAQLERGAAAESARAAAAEAEREREEAERKTAFAIRLAEARGNALEARTIAARAAHEERMRDGIAEGESELLLAQEIGRAINDELRRRLEEELELKREYRERELAEAQGFRDREAEAEFAHRARLIEAQSGETRRIAQVRTAFAKFELQEGRKTAKDRLAIVRDSAGALASHSKKAFRIQQAASLATAVVNIAQGVSAALAKGFPVGTIEAALIGAAGAAEIATIRSQRPPTGFARGGVVHDATFFGARGLGPAGGVAGEGRGPEGILPLARGPDGVLGVRVQGGAGARAITIAPSITVAAPPGQDPAETGDAIAGRIVSLLPAMIDARLQDQQRSGGLLNPQATV